METFWALILVSFFATNSLDKAESVQLEELEELPLQTFNELFVDECLDKLNPIQLISSDKLNPIQLISLDKLNPIQLISLDKLNPIQLIIIFLLSQSLITLITPRQSEILLKMSKNNKYSDSEQKELMKSYYEIKGQNPKTSDEKITKRLNINRATLVCVGAEHQGSTFHCHQVPEQSAARLQSLHAQLTTLRDTSNGNRAEEEAVTATAADANARPNVYVLLFHRTVYVLLS
uniref:Homeobox domain-containing protein n=1 Tax=Globodera rostochiensis TaxID=31243 RepID=A0A914HP80_GLORO